VSVMNGSEPVGWL